VNPIYASQNDEGQSGRSIHNLVYCSQASADLDDEVIASIIATARHHNPRLGITGLLVFGQGIFFQWLEGPRDNVTGLLARIAADTRHTNLVVLSQEDDIRDRLFPEWDMEWVEAADIREVLEDALEQSADEKQQRMLSQMLSEIQSGPLGS
jgi:Sensors of blue-light using FAD